MWDIEFLFIKIPGLDFHLFSGLNFVVMAINNLLNLFIAYKSNDYPNKTIWNTGKVNKNFQSSLVFCKLQLKETDKYKLVEICLNNLETFIDDSFLVEDMIFNKIQRIMTTQVKTYDKIILFLYNIKSRNIQETIATFENDPNLEDQPCSKKVFFFVNHTNHDVRVIVPP